jgi:hypothetical protein
MLARIVTVYRFLLAIAMVGLCSFSMDIATGGESMILTQKPPASVSKECWRQQRQYGRRLLAEFENLLVQAKIAASSSLPESSRCLLASLDELHESTMSYHDFAKTSPGTPFVAWMVLPISNEKILPNTLPAKERIDAELRVAACRGEYEPASFAVYAANEIKGLLAKPTAAQCGKFTIPASAIDIRVVKCWWQLSGDVIWDATHPTNAPALTPELLLKNEKLVQVDNATKRNTLLDPQSPRDAAELQPIDITSNTTRQYWVTVRVPEDAHPGKYRGAIELHAANMPPSRLALEIEVYPFALAEPRLQYAMYYRGCLTADGQGSIGSEAKSAAQYLAEMRDMKAHGVTHPTCYQGRGQLLEQAIAIRRRAGIANEPFYALGLGRLAETNAPNMPEQNAAIKRNIRAGVAELSRLGVKQLYVYGMDEREGEGLKAERTAFEVVHEAGGKVFVACYKDAINHVGDLLDLAVLAGPLVPEQAAKWHARGKRVFSYGNPQVGVEQPETYRRNYGLALWKAGYDGAMDYAYQHGFGNIWNDFDTPGLRDHVFAYPTVDGVIDTVEWEGFREGIDDVRYVCTLLDAIEQGNRNPAKQAIAAEAERWLRAIDVQGDLGLLRKQIIDHILQLRP